MIDVMDFYPGRSFVAALYWQTPDARRHRLQATYEAGSSLKLNDGWIHAGPDKYTAGERQLLPLLFWFGYFSDGARVYYHITAMADAASARSQRFQGYRLDASVNGYLGLYTAPVIFDNSPRWHLKGFSWKSLDQGRGLHAGLQLIGGGRQVRGNDELGPAYLNEQHGTGRGSLVLDFRGWKGAEPTA